MSTYLTTPKPPDSIPFGVKDFCYEIVVVLGLSVGLTNLCPGQESNPFFDSLPDCLTPVDGVTRATIVP